MSCSCSSDATSVIREVELSVLEHMRVAASHDQAEGYTTQRLWFVGEQATIANGTPDGKKGCVTVPYLGVPIKLCWEIKEIDPIPPSVSIKVRITISVAGVEYYSTILAMKCDDVANLSTCSIAVEGENALDAAWRPSCNWGCLRNCAPACITCGTNYWCWARCASSCVLRCCRLF